MILPKKFLILDCSYLAHRAKHVFGELSHKSELTGVIYGFFKEMLYLYERLEADQIVFCFDSRHSLRKDIYPKYKEQRTDHEELDDDELEIEDEFRRQVIQLREDYLPTMGFKNILFERGYEADDMIASVCETVSKKQEAVIVSADHDMYQLLQGNISIFDPRTNTTVTLQSFYRKYRVTPEQWIRVKCMAGCSTDNVGGIKGVGEKTAIKYILGELKETTKAYQRIEDDLNTANEIGWNERLIRLPFKGTPRFVCKADKLSASGWEKVMEKLGMKSLKEKMPSVLRQGRLF